MTHTRDTHTPGGPDAAWIELVLVGIKQMHENEDARAAVALCARDAMALRL
jgi:hypothetical protein